MEDAHSRAQGSLRRLDLRLPPLPQTLSRVLDLLHGENPPTANDMANAVQGDPAVLTRILKHINSAYYGLRRSITDVERAIYMMGPETAAGTVVSLCMLEIDELMEGPAGPCFRTLLRHSESTALLTRYLLAHKTSREGEEHSAAAGQPARGDGFTEGLLHDFGKLVLIYNYPEKAVSLYENRVFQEYLAEPDQRALEQLVFGCDHTEAGGYAASEMNFPQTLIDVVRYHHDLEAAQERTDATETVRAVGAANRATKAMGPAFAGTHPTDASLDWETCADHPVWDDVLGAPEKRTERQSAELMEDLSARRDDIVRFSNFFIGSEATTEQKASER